MLHHAYLYDFPEVRAILRANGYMFGKSPFANRMNRRGQMPEKLRHESKAEDSNVSTEEEELWAADQSRLSIKANEDDKSIDLIKELLASKESITLRNKDDPYILKESKLTKKQKLAHYKTPDFCIVTRADTLKILRLELDPLCEEKGFFF